MIERSLDNKTNDSDMTGKICLLTGATGGIGKALVTGLADRGATVLMVARDRVRGEALQRELVAVTGNPAIELFVADLADFSAVRRLAAEVRERHPILHVLINNAGVFTTESRLTGDGIEQNLAINYLSPFLLTNLLVNALAAGAPARVINVGSAAMAKSLNLDEIGPGRQPVGTRGYATAKLALLMASYAMARRFNDAKITVNVLHPGVTATGIIGGAVPRPLRPLFGWVMQAAVRLGLVASPEEGARTALYLATSPELETVTDRYFVNYQETASPAGSYDLDLQERLWQTSLRLTGLSPESNETVSLVKLPVDPPSNPRDRGAPNDVDGRGVGATLSERERNPMPKFLAKLNMSLQVFLYRVSGGRILGEMMGVTFLLLTTTGRKSGKVYTTPLGYFPDGDGYVIAASNAGKPRNPAWYYNLKAQPRATVQIRDRVIPVLAEETNGELRRQLWERRITLSPSWAKYNERTTREFPMLILKPIDRF